MTQQFTQKQLKEALKDLATTKDIDKLVSKIGNVEKQFGDKIVKNDNKFNVKLNTVEERLSESIRGLNLSLVEHLSRIEGKVDFIAQNATLRQELRNLVSQLKTQGIELDESKIFAV